MERGTQEPNPDRDRDRGERRALPRRELDRQAKAQLEEIRDYLSGRYARREVVTRTKTSGGLELDWVPVESQLRGAKLAQPPDESRPTEPDQGERRAEFCRFELQQEGAELGPDGTVPLLRTPIDRIIATVSLNDWLAKGRRAKRVAPADTTYPFELPATDVHRHSFVTQSVTCYGTEGNINAWDPYTNWSDEFSLGQLWLIRGGGNGQQTLEVGHQEYRDLYGDWVPHLFLFYTTNNYTSQGDNKGGYNTDVDGWVQYGNTIHPGGPVNTAQPVRRDPVHHAVEGPALAGQLVGAGERDLDRLLPGEPVQRERPSLPGGPRRLGRRDRRFGRSCGHHRDGHGQRPLAVRRLAALRIHEQPALSVVDRRGHDGLQRNGDRGGSCLLRRRRPHAERLLLGFVLLVGWKREELAVPIGSTEQPDHQGSVIPSLVDPDVECVEVEVAGGGPTAQPPGPSTEPSGVPPCPDGFVPRRRRRTYELDGKVIRTGQPAVRNPAADGRTDQKGDPPRPTGAG